MLPSRLRAKPSQQEAKKPSRGHGRPRSPARARSPTKSTTKSPTRPRSPGRISSPGRPRSPGRAKAPSKGAKEIKEPKSPSRSSARVRHLTPPRRSPIRRSPVRLFKEPEKARESSIPVAVTRKPQVVEADTDSDDQVQIDSKIDEVVKAGYIKEPSTESSLSSLARQKSVQKEIDRIVHLSLFENVSRKLHEFSDEDEFVRPALKPVSAQSILGPTLLLLVLPALIFWLLLDQKLEKLAPGHLFDATATLYYVSLLQAVAILGLLPVPNLFDRLFQQKKLDHEPNGALCIAGVALAVAAFYVDWVPVAALFLAQHELQLFLVAFLTGLVIGILAFLHSQWAPKGPLNPHDSTSSRFARLIVGRELQPKFLRYVDVKVLLVRMETVCQVLLVVLWAYRQTPARTFLQQAPLMVFTLYRLYLAAQRLLLERAVVDSKAIQEQGLGCFLSVTCLVLPFLGALPVRQLGAAPDIAPWHLGAVLAALLLFLFTQVRNVQRIRSLGSSTVTGFLSLYETIPTSSGRKLLASGLWGVVRHPDYLGAIIAELAVHSVLWPSPLGLLGAVQAFLLAYQAHRSDQLCRRQFGISWERYCNRVKYLLVPGVY